MTDSTRRALRTAYQVVLALVTTIPIIVTLLLTVIPADSDLAVKVGAIALSIAGGSALVTKVLNQLEDAGLIPAWLKGDTTVPAPVVDGVPVITDVPAADPTVSSAGVVFPEAGSGGPDTSA